MVSWFLLFKKAGPLKVFTLGFLLSKSIKKTVRKNVEFGRVVYEGQLARSLWGGNESVTSNLNLTAIIPCSNNPRGVIGPPKFHVFSHGLFDFCGQR